MTPLFDRGDPLGFGLYVGPVPGGGVDALPDFRGCSGLELVINKMVARSMAETLPLAGAPGGFIDFGENCPGWVGSPWTPGIAAQRATRLALVYGRIQALDPGSIVVAVTQGTGRGGQYDSLIRVSARTTTGLPLSVVLGVSAISVDLLSRGT